MNKFSFKDLVQEEDFKVKKSEPLWTHIEIPVPEERKVEYKVSKPRKGIKSLLDLNSDIKPNKSIVNVEVKEDILPEVILPAIVEENKVFSEKIDEPLELLEEKTHSIPISLADRAVDHITKEIKLEELNDSYQQPESTVDVRSFNDIKKRIQYLQDWIVKISLAGPGGGAGDILNLDIPTKVVTGDYTVTRYDYYVGVNCTSTANITLPSPSTIKNGREVIIKDESGRAQLNPIKVLGTVDNDSGGFEIRINNGAVQLVYRDGWRII